MSTPALVDAFYTRIWNDGDVAAAEELLADTFVFRGSLGAELRGRDQFLDYVRMVRSALDGYRCDILECVREDDRAFARMRFSGRHVGEFRGFAPTRKPVAWRTSRSQRLSLYQRTGSSNHWSGMAAFSAKRAKRIASCKV